MQKFWMITSIAGWIIIVILAGVLGWLISTKQALATEVDKLRSDKVFMVIALMEKDIKLHNCKQKIGDFGP
jgi:hypothetical protein